MKLRFHGSGHTLLVTGNEQEIDDQIDTLREILGPIEHAGSDQHPAVKVPAGEYEFEETPNPFGHPNKWLVLVGTKTGSGRGFLLDWEETKSGKMRITVC
jgi:hypothetical protein